MSNHCLILNGNGRPLSYFPLSAVDWKTAVKLVFTRNVIVIKEYSDWPTIPQVYLKGEFLGGSDILIEMYNSGSLKEKIEIELAS